MSELAVSEKVAGTSAPSFTRSPARQASKIAPRQASPVRDTEFRPSSGPSSGVAIADGGRIRRRAQHVTPDAPDVEKTDELESELDEVKADETEESEGEEGGAVEEAEEVEESEGEGSEEAGPPEFELSISTVGPESAIAPRVGAGGGKEDATKGKKRKQSTKHGASSRPKNDANLSSAKRHRVVLDANVGVATTATESPAVAMAAGRSADQMVATGIKVTTPVTGGLAVSPFGMLDDQYRFDNVKISAKFLEIKLDMTLVGDMNWGTNPGTNIDVPGPNAPVVTAASYPQIVDDLTPELIEQSWVASRQVYWSEAICQRHELYHVSDMSQWVINDGPGVVRTYLKKNPLYLTDAQRRDPATVQAMVQTELAKVASVIYNAGMDHYTGGAGSYYSRAGEILAFGDGKAPYEALAAGVQARGLKLQKDLEDKAKATAPPTL